METDSPLSRFQRAKQFLKDILLELPASSVEVEKAHANLQVDTQMHCSNAKRPETIQRDSYIMSAVREHDSKKEAIEQSCLGATCGKVNRLLKERVAERAWMPLSMGKSRSGLSKDGTVKRRNSSMLKGMLSFGCKSS